MSESTPQAEVKPYLRDDGSLCIPLNGDPKYFHWKPDGQSIEKTLLELNAPYETLVRYLGQPAVDKLMGKEQVREID